MPIYEYACRACGNTFEVFLSASDKPVKKCPECKSTRIQKLVSNCSFQLKGSGWYVTDYANKDKNSSGKTKKKDAEAGSADSGAKPEAKESSTSADSKPATKTENKAA